MTSHSLHGCPCLGDAVYPRRRGDGVSAGMDVKAACMALNDSRPCWDPCQLPPPTLAGLGWDWSLADMLGPRARPGSWGPCWGRTHFTTWCREQRLWRPRAGPEALLLMGAGGPSSPLVGLHASSETWEEKQPGPRCSQGRGGWVVWMGAGSSGFCRCLQATLQGWGCGVGCGD